MRVLRRAAWTLASAWLVSAGCGDSGSDPTASTEGGSTAVVGSTSMPPPMTGDGPSSTGDEPTGGGMSATGSTSDSTTGAPTTTDASTTTGAPGVCGDGVIDPG